MKIMGNIVPENFQDFLKNFLVLFSKFSKLFAAILPIFTIFAIFAIFTNSYIFI